MTNWYTTTTTTTVKHIGEMCFSPKAFFFSELYLNLSCSETLLCTALYLTGLLWCFSLTHFSLRYSKLLTTKCLNVHIFMLTCF